MPVHNAVLSRDHQMPDEQLPPADDLPALRLLVLPDLGPPFDDDPAAAAIVAAEAGAVGLGWSNRDGGAAASGAATAGTAATADGGAAAGGVARAATAGAAQAGARTGTADARTGAAGAGAAVTGAGAAQARADGDWARRFALLLCEALAGARPIRQIQPWTTERARPKLERLMPLFGGGQRPRVLRVITTRPTRDVIEMTVVVGLERRTRALAVRLERTDPADQAGWRDQSWLKQTARSQPAQPGPAAQPGLGGRPGQAPQPTRTGPRWLCTAIEAA